MDKQEMMNRAKPLFEEELEMTFQEEVFWDMLIISLDLNSIQYIKLIVRLEIEFDIEFDDDMFNYHQEMTPKRMFDFIVQCEDNEET